MVKKIKTKEFKKYVIEEISKKYRTSFPNIISKTLEEEISPYEIRLIKLKKRK